MAEHRLSWQSRRRLGHHKGINPNMVSQQYCALLAGSWGSNHFCSESCGVQLPWHMLGR